MDRYHNHLQYFRVGRRAEQVEGAMARFRKELNDLIEACAEPPPPRIMEIHAAAIRNKADLLALSRKAGGAVSREHIDLRLAVDRDTTDANTARILREADDELVALRARFAQQIRAVLKWSEEVRCLKVEKAMHAQSAFRELLAEALTHEEIVEENLVQTSKWSSQTHVLWLLLSDPAVKIAHMAWNGFCAGIGSFATLAITACLISYVLGLSWRMQWTQLFLWYWLMLSAKKCDRFFLDLLAVISLDQPHPRDPLGAMEDLVGHFLQFVAYTGSSSFIKMLYFRNFGHPWAFIKSMLFWNLMPPLVIGVINLLLIGIAYGIYRMTDDDLRSAAVAICENCLLTVWRCVQSLLRFYQHAADLVIRLFSKCSGLHVYFSIGRRYEDYPYFSYKRLDTSKREIRLLKVSRRIPFYQTPTLSLFTFPLDKAPEYEAISYTWAGQSCDHDMILDGNSRLKTTKNVLRIIRARASLKWTKWLWIDAVCINQDDPKDKIGQIELMGDIYSKAERVLAWLDYEPVPFIDLALMHILNRHLRREKNQLLIQAAQFGGLVEIIFKRMWRARTELYSQSYWTRGWIIQEVALAKKIHIVYGGQMLLWETVVETTAPHDILHLEQGAVMEIQQVQTQNRKRQVPNSTRSLISSLQLIRSMVKENGRMDLATALAMTTEFETTQQADRILSLLGIIGQLPVGLTSDHLRLPAGELFVAVARALAPSELEFVLQWGGIGYTRTVAGLPSWVPDWSAMSIHRQEAWAMMRALFKMVGDQGTEQLPWMNGLLYRAGLPRNVKFMTPRMNVGEHGPEWDGIWLSKITALSPPFAVPLPKEVQSMASFLNRRPEILGFLPAMQMMGDRFKGRYLCLKGGKDSSFFEAFWRTAIGDRWRIIDPGDEAGGKVACPAPAEAESCFRSFLTMLQVDHSMRPLPSNAAGNSRVPRATGLTTAERQEAQQFVGSLAIWGKCFALTEDEQLCLVPHLTHEGDKIIIVPGLQQPLVLRPKQINEGKTGHDYVGRAYVHGIMHGEVWDRLRGVS